jgi:hypothetical protein
VTLSDQEKKEKETIEVTKKASAWWNGMTVKEREAVLPENVAKRYAKYSAEQLQQLAAMPGLLAYNSASFGIASMVNLYWIENDPKANEPHSVYFLTGSDHFGMYVGTFANRADARTWAEQTHEKYKHVCYSAELKHIKSTEQALEELEKLQKDFDRTAKRAYS